MGNALPFSRIDQYLQSFKAPVLGCLVDTHFLVAATEEHHRFTDDAKFLFGKLAEYKIPIFTTVTTRSEFIDIRRRFIITETLMDMIAPNSPWKISASVKKILRAQKVWIDTQAKNEALPLMTDVRIKTCKEEFMPRSQSGQLGWIEICKEFLSGRLIESWDILVKELSLNYLDMRDDQIETFLPQKLEWKKMYTISEMTGLSSSDSMLVNALYSSSFPFIVSADFDIAYSILAGSPEKTVLIPDGLYKRKIKALRF